MIQFILMLLGLAFSNNNANTAACTNNNQEQGTVQTTNPGNSVDPGGSDGDTSGGSGQKPPQ